MNSRLRLLAALAVAAGVAAFLRRPIKPPSTAGSWQPADHEKTPR